jgi:undecaprenyl-phosphate galactose phosphotransferase/putative colanic acid biosynthesis UDP-glucose lipid carrier transferase
MVEVQRGPLSRSEQAMKRVLDIVVASIALVVFLPLFLMTAVAVKLDSPGPVFFRQRRNGFNIKPFRIFKFRSMTVTEDGSQISQATKSDPRVTRVGGILRRSSVDELPQLLNVLKGEMSLVGPRPHALAHDDQYGKLLAEYAFRHHVKPGITGWAQVNGFRGETSHIEQMRKRVDFDLWYINHWSIWLDLRILLKTGIEVSRSKNAY